jgi:hypothetical protein
VSLGWGLGFVSVGAGGCLCLLMLVVVGRVGVVVVAAEPSITEHLSRISSTLTSINYSVLCVIPTVYCDG